MVTSITAFYARRGHTSNYTLHRQRRRERIGRHSRNQTANETHRREISFHSRIRDCKGYFIEASRYKIEHRRFIYKASTGSYSCTTHEVAVNELTRQQCKCEPSRGYAVEWKSKCALRQSLSISRVSAKCRWIRRLRQLSKSPPPNTTMDGPDAAKIPRLSPGWRGPS